MKKKRFFPLSMGIGFLFTGLFCCFSVSADAVEGSPGQTVSGEYAVIINTDTSSSQNTGTLVFDDGTDTVSSYLSTGSSAVNLPASQILTFISLIIYFSCCNVNSLQKSSGILIKNCLSYCRNA